MDTNVKNNRILAAMTYIVIFGDLIKIPQLRIAGIVVTLFRAVTLIAAFVLVWKAFETRHLSIRSQDSQLLFLLLFWMAWAVVSMIFSPYSETRLGLKELLGLLTGLFIIFIYLQLGTNGTGQTIIIAIRNSVLILLLIGVLELATGYHLTVSRLVINRTGSTGMLPIVHTESHLATGIFFNENDFCCFLAVFSPTLLYFGHKTRRGRMLLSAASISIMLGIMVMDDANIAAFCTLIGLLFVLWRYKKMTTPVMVVILLAMPIGLFGLWKVWNHFTSVLSNQVGNYRRGIGSLSMRTEIYTESIKAFIQTHGWGVGAGGYANFIQSRFPTSRLVNPHCWWLEILSTYGWLVFLLYSISFFSIFNGLNQGRIRFKECTTVMACFLSFSIACLIPSSFLGYHFQWLLLAVGELLIRPKKDMYILSV